MRVINASIPMLETRTLAIGFVGENERTQIRFDAETVFSEFPHASPSLTIQPPSGEAYAIVVEREENAVVWDVTSSDLAFAGNGEIQLTFTKDSVVAKSVIGKINVRRSLQATGDVPSPIISWIDRATAKLAEVDAAIFALEQIDATVEGLPEGYDPTVSLTDYDDHKRFEFGIPRGNKGEKGDKGDTYELTQEDREEIARIAEDNFTDEVLAIRDECEDHADRAEDAADRAEQSAAEAGFMEMEIVNGHLIYRRTRNVDVDFNLVDGHLIMEVV